MRRLLLMPLGMELPDAPYMRRALLLASLWVMESALLAALFVPITAGAAPHSVLCAWAGTAGIMAGAFLVTWMLTRSRLPLAGQRWALLGILLLSALLLTRFHVYRDVPLRSWEWLKDWAADWGALTTGVTGGPAALVTLLVCWWRGMRLHDRPLSLPAVAFSFRLNVLWLVAAGLMWYPELGGGIALLVYIFFLAALVAMAVARVDEIAALPGGAEQPFGAAWLVTVMGSAVLVVAFGWLLARGISPAGFRQLGLWLAPLGHVLERALYQGLLALGVVMEPILEWLIRLVQQLAIWVSEGLAAFQPPAPAPQPTPMPGGGEGAGFPWGEVAKWLVIALLLMISLAGLALSLRKLGQREPAEGPQERRRSLPGGTWREDALHNLQNLVQSMLDRLAGLRPGRLGMEWYAEISIRNIYLNMCQLAAGRGYPRPAVFTPYEYLSLLYRAFPGAERGDIEHITEAYVRMRYGEMPSTWGELQAIRQAWQRVRDSVEVPASG